MKKNLMKLFLLVAILSTFGCAANTEFNKAFDQQSALTHNQSDFTQSPDSLFKIVKQVVVQQGFTLENADQKTGIVKAVRNMQDKKNKEISYNIVTAINLSEVSDAVTNVSVAASEQTILHRATTTWWHLLWIIPIIPTGTEYQTLVIKEGNVTDPQFYSDFFNSLRVGMTKHDLAVKEAAAKAVEKAEAERIAAENKTKAKRIEEDKAKTAEKAEKEKVLAAQEESNRPASGKSGAQKLPTEPVR